MLHQQRVPLLVLIVLPLVKLVNSIYEVFIMRIKNIYEKLLVLINYTLSIPNRLIFVRIRNDHIIFSDLGKNIFQETLIIFPKQSVLKKSYIMNSYDLFLIDIR